jgi:hypothetical protein
LNFNIKHYVIVVAPNTALSPFDSSPKPLLSLSTLFLFELASLAVEKKWEKGEKIIQR